MGVPKEIDKHFYDSTYKKMGQENLDKLFASKRTKKGQTGMRRRVPYAAQQKRVLTPPGSLRTGVIGKRILCNEGSGDERIKHLNEWEKG